MYASYLTDTAYNALPEWSPHDKDLTRRVRAETIWFAIVPGARENLDFTKTLMPARRLNRIANQVQVGSQVHASLSRRKSIPGYTAQLS